ncbi:MAG: helix-turn-helix domain-containing protein [Clostridia bacterium]|nr:helix-turn-helix domain-containing protein [Clostridia bacterium]
MIILSKFAERLKEYMDDKGQNATSLAKIIKSNRTSVSEYRRGIRLPSAPVFFEMLNYFNCSADYLLGLTDDGADGKVFNIMPPFGLRLREVMNFCGFSQYRIEKELKLSGSMVYNWLSNKSLPAVDSIEKIATHMGCTVDFLLGRES